MRRARRRPRECLKGANLKEEEEEVVEDGEERRREEERRYRLRRARCLAAGK